MAMDKTTITPDIEDDTDQWDWVPAAPHSHLAKAAGGIMLAPSCLTMGVVIGILWASAFQRSNVAVGKAAPDTPQSSQSASTPLSEPTLALGSPADTLLKPQDAVPKVPVTILNEGSAKTQIEQPHPRDAGRAQTTAAEVLPSKPQDASPKASGVSIPRLEPRRREDLGHETLAEKVTVKPAKKQSSDRAFKNYRDLRNYVLGE
jgi:hypothetical protein